jgi:hypothetical protein
MTGFAIANMTLAIAATAGAAGGFAGGFSGALASGASFSDTLVAGIQGAVFGGLTGAASFGVGQAFGGIGSVQGNSMLFGARNSMKFLHEVGRAVAHGAVGAASNIFQGGKAAHGFLAGAISSLGSSAYGGLAGGMPQTFAGKSLHVSLMAAIGGTVSELSGGSFASGAVTGAFATLFNHLVNHKGPVEPAEEDGWKNLSKNDLELMAITEGFCSPCSNYDLGIYFEEVFERHIISTGFGVNSGLHRNDKLYKGSRNTVPDFVGDEYTFTRSRMPSTRRLPGTVWVEMKAKYGGGLYKSSNKGQIYGHISNLNSDTFHHRSKYPGYKPTLVVITTKGVRISQAIFNYADGLNVNVQHVIPQYRRYEDGTIGFRFNQTVTY